MELIATFIASLLTAVLGRLGGWKETKLRDLGIPTVVVALLILLGVRSPIALFLSFGLMFAALTTYWDFLFGYDEFFAHGFFIGLSLAPIAFVTGHWWMFGACVALYTIWMGLWSKILRWDVAEEFVRYSVIPLGIYILTR